MPLTDEEAAEKESLADQGFPDWQRRHFQSFIKACERFGRTALDRVAGEISDKTEDEVRAYAKVFFKRVGELKGECEEAKEVWCGAVLIHTQ